MAIRNQSGISGKSANAVQVVEETENGSDAESFAEMKNGSHAIRDAEATVRCSVILIAKRLTKKRADAERKNGSDSGKRLRK